MHDGLVELAVEQLDVLLVLHGELGHYGLICAIEGLELGRHAVEPGVLAELGILIELAGSQLKLSGLCALGVGLDPGVQQVKLLLAEVL